MQNALPDDHASSRFHGIQIDHTHNSAEVVAMQAKGENDMIPTTCALLKLQLSGSPRVHPGGCPNLSSRTVAPHRVLEPRDSISCMMQPHSTSRLTDVRPHAHVRSARVRGIAHILVRGGTPRLIAHTHAHNHDSSVSLTICLHESHTCVLAARRCMCHVGSS